MLRTEEVELAHLGQLGKRKEAGYRKNRKTALLC